jgi:carbonic anhydrase/acetyltransferase-like protein (isoleucine patch superfamily)
MNAVVLEHARVGAGSMVAAGSTVLAHVEIPANMLAAGIPAVVKKRVSGAVQRWIDSSAEHYVEMARRYKERGLE